ncbi:MAG TPA: EAL domain-containing protein [Candidatus Sulfotelmatobacter sp.]|nr:EAL domain-containing protein [Candidatus Sulfotelmatobacter sp.]
MFTPSHLVGLLVYAAIALAIAVGLPQVAPVGFLTAPVVISALIGLVVFLVLMLVHEAAARHGTLKALAGRMLGLADVVSRQREEVRQMRDVQRAQSAALEGAAEVETVAKELRGLRAQVDQLAARRAAAPATAGAYAGEPQLEVPTIDLDDPRVLRSVVRDALGADRVDLYVQPIATLPQRKVEFFECFPYVRMEDGTTIPAPRYLPVAQEAGLMASVDNATLFRVVQLVRRMRRRQQPVGFFCNVSGATLNDATFFADFIGFMRDNADLSSTLIFEISQYDLYHLKPGREPGFASLVELGFRFSLDQITNLDLFVSDLNAQGFRYAKLDAATLLEKLDRAGDPRSLKRALDRGAIDLVVSGIDTDKTLLDLLDYAIDFGQGALFGEPRPAD